MRRSGIAADAAISHGKTSLALKTLSVSIARLVFDNQWMHLRQHFSGVVSFGAAAAAAAGQSVGNMAAAEFSVLRRDHESTFALDIVVLRIGSRIVRQSCVQAKNIIRVSNESLKFVNDPHEELVCPYIRYVCATSKDTNTTGFTEEIKTCILFN